MGLYRELACLTSTWGMGWGLNYNKAMKLFLRAGELGYSESYSHLGAAYFHGRGVERVEEKAKYYYELAAMGGCVE